LRETCEGGGGEPFSSVIRRWRGNRREIEMRERGKDFLV